MESKKNKEFDNKLKAKLGDFSSPVPVDLWNKIESRLDAFESPKVKQITKLRVSIYGFYSAIAATILIAFAFWKFGDTEAIYLRKNPEVLVSEILIDNGQHYKEREKNSSNYESLPKKAYFHSKEKIQKMREKVVSTPQKSKPVRPPIVKIVNETDADYIVQFVEPTSSFSLASSKMSLHREKVFNENNFLALKESVSIEEESQDRSVEEIEKPRNKKLGVSTILNFLTKGLNNGDDNLIEFSESEEGVLKLDLKLGLVKSKD